MHKLLTRGSTLAAALAFSACGQDVTAPAAVAGSGGSGNDTQCVAALTGTFDNVVVPPGATCSLSNSTVRGNVKALERSTLSVSNTQVRGSIEGDKANIVQIFGGTVGGNISIKESTFTPSGLVAAFISGTVVLEGNVEIQKNVANAVRVFGVTLNKGNMKIEDNVTAVFDVTISGNRVAQNLQVFKNKGAGRKTVSGNTVGQDLQCFENDPPFVGGPNTAGKAEGQCF